MIERATGTGILIASCGLNMKFSKEGLDNYRNKVFTMLCNSTIGCALIEIISGCSTSTNISILLFSATLMALMMDQLAQKQNEMTYKRTALYNY